MFCVLTLNKDPIDERAIIFTGIRVINYEEVESI